MESITTDLDGNVTDVQVSIRLMHDSSGQYVAYCPALELSSYGDTEAEARYAFDDALASFTKDVAQRGSLNELLAAFGWQKCVLPTMVTYTADKT